MKYLLFILCVLFQPLYADLSKDPMLLSVSPPNATPQIAVSKSGKAIAVWTNSSSQGQIAIQARYFTGNSWISLTSEPTTQTKTIPTIAYGSAPKAVIDGLGNAIIVFVKPNNQIFGVYIPIPTIVTTSVTPISTQTPAFYTLLSDVNTLNNSPTISSNISPTIAIADDGTAIAVWIQNIPFQVLFRFFVPSIPGRVAQWLPFYPNPLFIPTTAQPTGTYPASLGLDNSKIGTAVWLDGPTGQIISYRFPLPP